MQLFKKIANICLALVLMVATAGITLNKHYCLGQLKSVSVFQEAESCMSKMEMDEDSCPMECCDDTSEEYKLEEFKQVSFEHKFFTPELRLIAIITYYFANADVVTNSPNLSYSQYLPPLIDQDIPVMVQSFLL